MDATRRLCTLALWLGAGLVVVAWLVTVLPAWREVIALRRDLFRARS